VILENNDERVQEGLRDLSRALSRFVDTFAKFDQSLIDQVKFIVKDHAASFKAKHGYEFPPLGVFAIPTARFIICARKDLEDREIHNQLLIWLRQFSERNIHPSAIEIARAVQECWPQYKPPIEQFRKDTKVKLKLN